jgi:hypothetical protein
MSTLSEINTGFANVERVTRFTQDLRCADLSNVLTLTLTEETLMVNVFARRVTKSTRDHLLAKDLVLTSMLSELERKENASAGKDSRDTKTFLEFALKSNAKTPIHPELELFPPVSATMDSRDTPLLEPSVSIRPARILMQGETTTENVFAGKDTTTTLDTTTASRLSATTSTPLEIRWVTAHASLDLCNTRRTVSAFHNPARTQELRETKRESAFARRASNSTPRLPLPSCADKLFAKIPMLSAMKLDTANVSRVSDLSDPRRPA